MAERTVKVNLEAKINGYVPPVAAAREETERLDASVNKVDRDLKKLPPDAAKAAAAMKLLGADFDSTGKKVGDLGKRADSLKTLELRIQGLKIQSREMAAEFNKTGDSGILGKLFNADRDIKALENLRKTLTRSMGPAGADAGAAFAEAFSGGLSSAMPFIIPVIAGTLMEALAAVGGLSSSLLGAGVIAGAVIAQFQDPRIAAAGKQLGHGLKAELLDATSPLSGSILVGMDKLGMSLGGAFRELKQDLIVLQPYAEMFFDGLRLSVEKFMPGFSKGLKEAGPVLAVFAKDLPILFEAFGKFFEEIGREGKGGAEAMTLILRAVGDIIIYVGKWIALMEYAFDKLLRGSAAVLGVLDSIAGHLVNPFGKVDNPFGDLHKQVQRAVDDWDQAGAAQSEYGALTQTTTVTIGNQVEAINLLQQSIKSYQDQLLDGQHATIDWERDLDNLTQSVKDNGRSLDDHTEKGRRNHEAMLKLVEDAKATRERNILLGMSMESADAQYDKQIDKVRALAKSLGLTKSAIAEITGVHLIEFRYVVHGTPPKDLSYASITTGRIGGMRYGGIASAATGNIFSDTAGPAVKFLERGTGAEGFVPQRGISHARAGTLLGTMAGWHGFGLVDGSNRWRGAGGGGGQLPPVNLTVNLLDTDGHVTRKALIRDALNKGVPGNLVAAAYPG